MGFLLDTNVLSMLAPPSAPLAPDRPQATVVRRWMEDHDQDIFLSTITLAELQAGISRLERRGVTRRAVELAHWLDAILSFYDDRILSLTSSAALQTGRLLDRALGSGADPGFEDAAIAAIAATHGHTVVTVNIRHFEHFGVPCVLPPK